MDSLFVVGLVLVFVPLQVVGLPDLRDTPSDPMIIRVNDDAVLTCVVKDVENYTVIWKKFRFGRAEVLSANSIKVSSDPRISIAQSDDKWILEMKDVKMADTGQYICEVNSVPAVQVSIIITVTPPPPLVFALNHNYTSCCKEKKVSASCMGFCSLRNVVLGTTGASPHSCTEFLPVIAECMADGRNHMPCCIREKIPEECRQVCHGKFGVVNETIVSHYTCSRYSRATLACIAEGIELLPGSPRRVTVEPISSSEIKVSWEPPIQKLDTIMHYVINVTELATFDDMSPETWEFEHEANSTGRDTQTKYVEETVNKSETDTTLENLKPYTMYEITVTSVNNYGTSLPTATIRALTLQKDIKFIQTSVDNTTLPSLPDIRGCCASKGMKQERCLDLFCDPVKADFSNLTDMMICAPWINTSVSCLVDGRDHTPCCQQHGLPQLCLPLCAGKIQRIDFRFFRCIAFMSSYTNCLMQGYGVLPSAPAHLALVGTGPTWAVLEWDPPKNLSSTVTSYNFHYKTLEDDEQNSYGTLTDVKSPFIFNHVTPNTEYEVYVTAVNKFGAGEPSARLKFDSTNPDEAENETDVAEMNNEKYNFTECCIKAEINETCLPLCSYKAKIYDLRRLSSLCEPEFHKLLKCAVGGRDHTACCNRRMVSPNCLPICSGTRPNIAFELAATFCIPHVPDVILCLEEGVVVLPGPVRELHAFAMNSTMIGIQWLAPTESNVSYYEVRYQGDPLDESEDEMNQRHENIVINVTETSVTITSLSENTLYSLFVVSVNDNGMSVPSYVLTFNTSNPQDNLKGVVSPPHYVMLVYRNTTSFKVGWQPPDISHPHDAITYKVYYKMYNETKFTVENTTTLRKIITDLIPNREYYVFVTAVTEKGESWPSEEIRVWTDPVFPAFVEMPQVHPSTQIEEGGPMTILCVASGTPIPKIGIFVSGRKIVEEFSRHLVAKISNISRDMNVVTCTADNGVGVGSQSTLRIKISHAPTVVGRRPQTRRVGETVLLECLVDGFPKPHLTWWRDQDKTMPILNDGRITSGLTIDEEGNDVFQLIIQSAATSDEGPYYCTANNPFGNSMDKVSLQLDPIDAHSNVSSCCIEENVNPECMDACTFDIDIESVANRQECVPELTKLIHCAADGSDHRRCCQTWGIPKRCIGLCQGKQQFSFNVPLCLLSWSKQIVSCFQEGKQLLPGIPENLHVKLLTVNSVLVQWDPPDKNPHMVQYYRVWAKPLNQKKPIKLRNDTHGLSLVMTNLKPGFTYEFVVKANNHFGSSLVSDPVQINLLDEQVMESLTEKDSNYTVAIIVGLLLTLLFCAVAIVAIVYFKRRRRIPPPDAVSFENPSYMREMSDGNQTNGNSSGNSRTNEIWKSEALHAPPDGDNLYEVPADDRTAIKKGTGRTGYVY